MATPQGLREAVEDLGLQRALGFVRMLRLSADDPLNYPEPDPLPPHAPVDLADLRCAHVPVSGCLRAPEHLESLLRWVCRHRPAIAYSSACLHASACTPPGAGLLDSADFQ